MASAPMTNDRPATDQGKIALEAIRARIEAGDHAGGIGRLRTMIDNGPVGPDAYRLLALAHLKAGSQGTALTALQSARDLGTSSAAELAFGRFLNKEGFGEAALACFQAAIALEPDNADAHALVSWNGAALGRTDLAQLHGQRSLEIRDFQSMQSQLEPVLAKRPTGFNPAARNRQIIAYSLFGKTPYYWESAIASASMAYAMFPEWCCRFYCDSNVPNSVRRTLVRLRAQVMIADQNPSGWTGLLWRFFAFDDPNVDVVMVRDVDSPFTLRERLAVDEWLASTKPFHVIRDAYSHSEPMMAGLWGGWTRLLPPLRKLATEFRGAQKGRFIDQEFLRLCVWPRIRAASLAHDRHFRLDGTETRSPPQHPTGASTHIGMSWPRRIAVARTKPSLPPQIH